MLWIIRTAEEKARSRAITRRPPGLSRRSAKRPAGTSVRISKSFSVGSKEAKTSNKRGRQRMAAGESKNHASNKNNTNRTRNQPSNQPAREARVRKTNGNQGKDGAAGKGSDSYAGAGAVKTVQT